MPGWPGSSSTSAATPPGTRCAAPTARTMRRVSAAARGGRPRRAGRVHVLGHGRRGRPRETTTPVPRGGPSGSGRTMWWRARCYLTGGIGARHEGEAFGGAYRTAEQDRVLRDLRAIANVTGTAAVPAAGDAKYVDVWSGPATTRPSPGSPWSGDAFFYPNALESDGTPRFNQGAPTREPWFDSPAARRPGPLHPVAAGLRLRHARDTVYVNLYARQRANVDRRSLMDGLRERADAPTPRSAT